MDDVVKSIKAHLYDRVVSPLFGAFLISWAIWNYRIIFVLLSSEIIPYKFNYIDEYYSSIIYFLGVSISKCWAIGIAAPLLSALSYIYLYPFFALPVYKFSLSRQKKLADTKNVIEGATLLTLEKSRKIIQDSKKMQISYDEKLHQAEDEIDALKKIIVDIGLEVEKLTNEKNTLDNKNEPSFSVDFSAVEGKIRSRVSNLSEGEIFVVSDAFGASGWGSFNELEKAAIENVFKYHVSAKMYDGIIFSGKNNIGENTYQLNSKRYWEDFSLNETSSKVVKYLVQLGVGGKDSLQNINAKISGNIFETDDSVEKLFKSGYLSKISSGSGYLISLSEKGKQYAIKNEYHI